MTLRTIKRAGFTLLEVMIALAIVAGLVTTLLYTISHHLDIASRHESVTMGVLLGRQKLAEYQSGSSTTMEGSFPEPNSAYTYNIQTSETVYPGVHELTVTIVRGSERIVLKELLRTEVLGK